MDDHVLCVAEFMRLNEINSFYTLDLAIFQLA